MASMIKRLTKDGKEVYDIRYWYADTLTGVSKQTTKRGMTYKQAKAFMTEVEYKKQTDTFVKRDDITLREFLLKWLKEYVETNLKPTTIDGYRRNIEGHIIPCLGNIKLQKLKITDLDKFYSSKAENGRIDGKGGLSPRSLIYIHRVLSEALNDAVRKQLISRNVAKDIRGFRARKYECKVFDKDTISKLLEAVKGEPVRVAIALAALSGMRRGEVCGLKWEDIDVNRRTITIRRQLVPTSKGDIFQEPKSKDSIRTIYISDILMNILLETKQQQNELKELLGNEYSDQNLVFCNDNGFPVSPSRFSHNFKYILKKHGFEHIRFHDLRHSCATLMLTLGVPLKVTSGMLGHSTVGITADLYSHVLDDMQKSAVQKIDSAFSESNTDIEVDETKS